MIVSTVESIRHKLPQDEEGFTKSFDINSFEPIQVKSFYEKYGLVIFDNVINEEQIQLSIQDLWDDVEEYSNGSISYKSPQSWKKFNGFLDRFGFVNNKPISKPQIWKNRSHPNVYKAFKRLHQISSNEHINEPLLALFDRGSILRPSALNPKWKTRPIYHFDIDPWQWTGVKNKGEQWRMYNSYDQQFCYWLGEGNYVPKVKNYNKLQGVLAFSKTDSQSGGFQCVCGFQNYMKQWCIINKSYIDITQSPQLMENMQKCYQRPGSLLVFTRQLPHNIYPNVSENFRYAQYLRISPQSSLMLTAQEKMSRKEQIKKMLPSYIDLSNEICRQIYMCDYLNDNVE